jgi:hypothetical protein
MRNPLFFISPIILILACMLHMPCAAQLDTLQVGYYSHASRVSSWASYAQEGCNLLMPYGTGGGGNWGTYLDAAQTAGLRIILDLHHHPPRWYLSISTTQIRNLAQQYRNHPALYGYYIADEPEAPWNNEPPSAFQPIYNALKTGDPGHPVLICMNVRLPAEYTTIFDELMPDHYPNWESTNNQPEFNGSVRYSYTWWRNSVNYVNQYNKDGCILVGLAGGDGTGGNLRDLTYAEYRWHVFSGIVLGVNGFVFYWDDPSWLTPSVHALTRQMIRQMRAIGPQMVRGRGVTDDPRISVNQTTSKLRYRYGVVGSTHVLLAVNVSRWDASDSNGETLSNVQFTLPPEVLVSQVEVLDENRTLPVTDRTFTDSFSRFQVHVYRFGGPPANQPPAVTLTSPVNGSTYTAPANIVMNATASDVDGTVSSVRFYSGTTLLGTDTASPYEHTWTGVPVGSYQLRAVAQDNQGAVSTSAVVAITVLSSGPNQPPVVSLTSPVNNSTYSVAADIVLRATASDPDGGIARVEFYTGTTLLNSDTTSPYEYTWSRVGAGTYVLSARAYDVLNASATSGGVTVSVLGRTAQAPFVLAAPVIDGSGADWAGIPVGITYRDQSGRTPASVDNAVSVKAGWDTGYLYLLFETTDTNLQAVTSQRDGAVYMDDCVEVFIDTAADGGASMRTDDYHFVVNILNTLFDSQGTGSGQSAAWNGNPAVISSVAVRGTIGNEGDADGGYTVEVAIPWASIGVVPASGMVLGMNFCGTDRDAAGDGYQYYDWCDLTSFGVPDYWGRVTLVGGGVIPNQPPTVSLTSPVNNSTYTAPTDIPLAATATDSDGTIASVRFYRGSTLLATDTASPYEYTWTNVSSGTYQLRAVAQDNQGATSTSTVVTVTVLSSSTPAVWYTLATAVNPAGGGTVIPASGTYLAGSQIQVTATPNADYTFATWSGDASGTNPTVTLTMDSNKSITANFTYVPPANSSPVVSIISPPNGATLTAPTSITITATATDTDGTITAVRFYHGTTLLATDSTSPYEYTWTGVPAGSYVLTARAEDNGGAVGTSPAVTITVNPETQPSQPQQELKPGEVRIVGGQDGYINATQNPTVTIRFRRTSAGVVTVRMYDLRGRLVVEKSKDGIAGIDDDIAWNAVDLPAGVYIVRMSGAGISRTHRIAMLR